MILTILLVIVAAVWALTVLHYLAYRRTGHLLGTIDDHEFASCVERAIVEGHKDDAATAIARGYCDPVSLHRLKKRHGNAFKSCQDDVVRRVQRSQ